MILPLSHNQPLASFLVGRILRALLLVTIRMWLMRLMTNTPLYVVFTVSFQSVCFFLFLYECVFVLTPRCNIALMTAQQSITNPYISPCSGVTQLPITHSTLRREIPLTT